MERVAVWCGLHGRTKAVQEEAKGTPFVDGSNHEYEEREDLSSPQPVIVLGMCATQNLYDVDTDLMNDRRLCVLVGDSSRYIESTMILQHKS